MHKMKYWFIVSGVIILLLSVHISAAERRDNATTKRKTSALQTHKYSIKNDIAFISVWGARPEKEKLQGFRYAVLYTAKGEFVQKIDIGSDSVYSLDKMIQDNKSRGPLFIKMYRR